MERIGAVVGLILTVFLFPLESPATDRPPPAPTLCVLDFHRLGEGEAGDWLGSGLADMIRETLRRTGPFTVIEREFLRELLREHDLAGGGLSDPGTSVRVGRLARADLLLTGSFAREGDTLRVQARLLRLADQKTVSLADWTGTAAAVMDAPPTLSRGLLAGLGTPFDEKFLAGIGEEIPLTVDTAASFYGGLEAFDGGEYHLALALYLEGLRGDRSFLRLRREIFRMYYLLGRSDHAVFFARSTASELWEENPAAVLEFLHRASQKALAPLKNAGAAIFLLEEADRLGREHEEQTGEAADIKAFVRKRALALADSGPADRGADLLADPDLRWRIWTADVPAQLERRARTGDFHWRQRDGEWAREPVPEPSVFMWRIRALVDLARTLAAAGRTEESLTRYRQILDEYSFLNDLPLVRGPNRFYWDNGIRLEAHFMILRHYGITGKLLRDPVLTAKVIVADSGAPFERDLSDDTPHPRARVWSRRADGSHEFFDFAAPPGRQVTKVTFESAADGPAWVSLYLPQAEGWPPQFDFSRRLSKVFLPSGRSSTTFDLPEGTGFFSLSILWGPRWANTFREHLRSRTSQKEGEADLSWWKATFQGTPAKAAAPPADTVSGHEGDGKLFSHYAGRWGWDEGRVVRDDGEVYDGTSPFHVSDEEWMAFSRNGDIAVFQRDTFLSVPLPLTVNTDEDEFAPGLVPTHEGGYALLWERGLPSGPSSRFVAGTADFLRWGSPKRLVFENPDGENGTGRRRFQGSSDVIPVPGGYLMLLEDGHVRFSEDLVVWRPPEKRFDYDGLRQRTIRTSDGRIWVAATRHEDREIEEGKHPAEGFGFYRTADGKIFQKNETLIVYSSTDGRTWSDALRLHSGAEPSGLWLFPVGSDAVAVAAGYNNLGLSLFVSRSPESFRPVATPLKMPLNGEEASFYLDDDALWAARVVHDFVNEDFVLLLSSSKSLFKKLRGGGQP